MDVDIIISVYSIDRANDVIDCIDSVKRQTLTPKNIFVVLDPDDALVTYFKKRLTPDSNVKVVVSDEFGLSAARNKGVKSSASEFVAFIDDDAVADCNWLQTLVSNFNDSSVAGVGGRIIPVWPRKDPSWFPEELYWIVGCSYKGLPTKKEPIRNPIGCNMAFRRSVLEKIGYFSTATGRIGNKLMGHDDTEIGIRITSKLLGTLILYDPRSVVYHRVSANRVSLKYIIKRSYAEGYSKAFISIDSSNGKSDLGPERRYLRLLCLSAGLLFKSNLRNGITRLATIWISTLMVFLGFLVGHLTKRN